MLGRDTAEQAGWGLKTQRPSWTGEAGAHCPNLPFLPKYLLELVHLASISSTSSGLPQLPLQDFYLLAKLLFHLLLLHPQLQKSEPRQVSQKGKGIGSGQLPGRGEQHSKHHHLPGGQLSGRREADVEKSEGSREQGTAEGNGACTRVTEMQSWGRARVLTPA